jgi:hypothetical protein
MMHVVVVLESKIPLLIMLFFARLVSISLHATTTTSKPPLATHNITCPATISHQPPAATTTQQARKIKKIYQPRTLYSYCKILLLLCIICLSLLLLHWQPANDEEE